MAHIIRDGFDLYTSTNDIATFGWSVPNLPTIANLFASTGPTSGMYNTRFNVGQSLILPQSSSGLSYVFANRTTVFVAFALWAPSGVSGACHTVLLEDGGTVQCSIQINADGTIKFYRGNAGTLLATYTGGFTLGTWVQFQFKVVIDPTNGEFHVRRNGNTVDDFSATGLNDRSTANTQINQVNFNGASFSNRTFFDDVWVWDNTGSAPNDWIGDYRCQVLYPHADSAVQFAQGVASLNVQPVISSTGTLGDSANLVWTMFGFYGRAGTAASISLSLASAMTGHLQLAIYDATGTGNTPGNLVAATNALTNPGAGTNTFTFASPPTLQEGTPYFVMALADASFTLNTGPISNVAWSPTTGLYSANMTRTYASGFPSAFTATNAFTNNWAVGFVTITASGNNGFVSDYYEDGSASYLQDANVGDKDLYTSAGLSVTPTAILGVSLKVFAAKSDSGARSGAPTMTSGSTVQDGPTTVLSTSYAYMNQVQDTDPATGAAWTPSAVNALKFGMKVVA